MVCWPGGKVSTGGEAAIASLGDVARVLQQELPTHRAARGGGRAGQCS